VAAFGRYRDLDRCQIDTTIAGRSQRLLQPGLVDASLDGSYEKMSGMKRNPPPPVIDAARVVSYAFVDDIPFLGAAPLFAAVEYIEQVPRLAIAVGLAGHDDGPRVFHCDEEWIALGASGAETVEQAKQEVERNYPGVGERWVDTHVTVEEALAFYDSETAGLKCSFCGKRPFEVEGLIESPKATICRDCVEEFYSDFQTGDDEVIGN
jgi:hypothetical protein